MNPSKKEIIEQYPELFSGVDASPDTEQSQTDIPEDASGFIVFWSATSTDWNNVQSALESAPSSIKQSYPNRPGPATALTRAKAKVQRSIPGVVFRTVRAGCIGVVVEEDEEREDWRSYKQEALVRAGEGGLVQATDAIPSSACSNVLHGLDYEYQKALNTAAAEDTTNWILNCLRDVSAVPLRPHGGVYYVRKQDAQRIMTIKRAAEAAGCAKVYTMALCGDSTTVDDISTSSAEAFLGDFHSIERDIQDWASGLADAKRPGRGFGTLHKQLSTLKDRVFMYREALSHQKNALEAKIEGAQSALKQSFEDFTNIKKNPAYSQKTAAKVAEKKLENIR